MVLGGEGNKHPHGLWIRMCTSGRNTQKYQRWWLVLKEAPLLLCEYSLSPTFIIILMTLEWLLTYKGQSCIGNLLLLLRMANWPFLDYSSSPWTAGLNLSRRTVSSLALPSSGALRMWWRGEMECFEFPFWILETGIAVADQVLILFCGRLAQAAGAGPALLEPHNSPRAGGLRQVWEASATNPTQVLPVLKLAGS